MMAYNPEDIFLLQQNEQLTYGDFFRQVTAASEHLLRLGIRKGTLAAIECRNNKDFVILFFSLLKIRAIPVPLNLRLTGTETAQLLDFLQCGFLFRHKELLNHELQTNTTVLSFPFENIYSESTAEIPAFDITDELLSGGSLPALVMFTSGTTGKPKGVVHTYSSLIASAELTDSLVSHTRNDRWIASLPFYHIGGLMILIRAIIYGCSVVLPDSFHSDEIAGLLASRSITIASFVSTVLKRLTDAAIPAPSALRAVFLGGGPIDDDLARDAAGLGYRIIKVYGSTETCSMVSAVDVNERPDKLSSAGKPISSESIRIADSSGRSLEAMQPGEVVISGQTVFQEYIFNTGETGDKLKRGEYWSGDYGYLDEDGYLFIQARRSDLIISGGENINPFEVEREILNFPGVKEVCVFSAASKEWGQTPEAAVVLTEGAVFSEDELEIFLRQRLAAYKIPGKFHIVKALPKTELGKLKRDAVRQMFA